MHQALYRKWRPQTFDDVYGQEHITSVLKYETANAKLSHAYLFCGSRGTGKTTCAKILAKAVNCEAPENGNPCNKCPSCRAIDAGSATDVLEMDAASNNGVDSIRDIRDEVVYTPSSLKYRVYIVDEVHMLSGNAFNALLKTLEEPPSHVVFVLATTELHKLPATIVSRCQRFDFRRIAVSDIMARLALIAQKEGISYENDALRLIAKYAQGGMRDAISLFELCAGTRNELTADTVIQTIGSSGNEVISNLLIAISSSDYDTVFATVDDIVSSSRDIAVFWNDLIVYCRNILIFKTAAHPEKYLDLTDNEQKRLAEVSNKFTKETVLYFLRLLNDSLFVMQKAGASKRNVAEMTLIRMGDESLDTSADAILSRVSKIEVAISGARFTYEIESPKISDVGERKSDNIKPIEIAQKTEAEPSVAETKQEKSNSTVPSEKMIRGWNEAVEKVSANNPALLSFLKMSRAYSLSDGRVSIRFANPFALNMVKEANITPILCANVGAILKRRVSESEIEFVVSQTKMIEEDDLDDIEQ